ncbi:DUF3053 family protein [Bosea sp. 124]|uniref:DUF3053 family protein n=1 Tax=Bosea sp. 124 TaxID=2135642 RepID=UPI000D3BB490|nr:DUF3053 family protein [Bosea sp. 124]PTM38853.1 hypothetical protein C8D03_0328 [Bosea sp. 124]
MAGRLLTLLTCLLVGLLLAACGQSEADQRQAFIAFLQTEVLPKPGARVPQPNAEKLTSFGDYAGHYAVITRFHERMNASVANPMQDAMSKGMPRSIEEVATRKADIAAVRAGFVKMRDALDRSVATADAERDALKQPADLASVYAATYDKLVAQPVATFREIFPPTDDAFGAVLELAELIDANRPAIRFNGAQMEINNIALRTKMQTAMTAMTSKQRAMIEAQQKLRRMVYGG